MKLKKIIKRYCKFCKKHTTHKISLGKTGVKRGALKHGSLERAKKRGSGSGFGNKGKWGSKPAISKFKRTGAKVSKKTSIKYTCQTCKKSTIQAKGKRSKKIEME